MHDDARDVGDARCVAQQLVLDLEEAAVDEVVVLDARERAFGGLSAEDREELADEAVARAESIWDAIEMRLGRK